MSIHKILIHGREIIGTALLPIGQLSEEAQEAKHKHLKQYRRDFSRKTSRRDCNEDIMHQLLVSSDPFINGLKKNT